MITRCLPVFVFAASSAAASISTTYTNSTPPTSNTFDSSHSSTIPSSGQLPGNSSAGLASPWTPGASELVSPVAPTSESTATRSVVITRTITVCLPSTGLLSSIAVTSPTSPGSDTQIAASTPNPSTFPSSCDLPSSTPTNALQDGDSLWGTLCQPTFPRWLDGNSGPYKSAPWGNKTTQSADATVHHDLPITNVTRYYNFTISRGRISPDGVLRDVMMVNGQFPGPAIEANWGDTIQVTVNNNITAPMEGTALHWHGMLQRGTPWYDGVPAVSQCPIAPGHSFTYSFAAQIYGSSFYHAHYSAQYTAGVVGPLVVYGPSQSAYDIDIGPVLLSDWNHIPYFSMVTDVVGTNLSLIPPASDGILINGRGRFNCSDPSYSSSVDWLGSNLKSDLEWTCVEGAGLAKFKFQPGKVHRIRLVNHGADGIQKFSIDGHQLSVIATDFVPNAPYDTDAVTLGVGQRTDVLVTANNNTHTAYWMRAQMPGGVPCGGSRYPETLAAVYYEGADTTIDPSTISSVADTACENQALDITAPMYPIKPTANPHQQDLELSLKLNSTGSFEFLVNGQTFRANFNYPTVFLAAEGNVSYPDPQWNVYNFGQNTSIVFNITNHTPLTHPFHLHGHDFAVLNVGGAGTVWDGTTINPENPMRRDTQIIPVGGFVALSFESNNPGMWSFHCHVAWHLSAGLSINVLTHPEDIPTIPDGMREQTCTDWEYFSENNTVDQIDSGS